MMITWHLSIIVLIEHVVQTTFGEVQQKPTSPEVTLKYGQLRGRSLFFTNIGNTDEFYGIPFAKPPTGDLRFARPVDLDPWLPDTYDLNRRPPVAQCSQPNPYVYYGEDCLYLNVWTPELKRRQGPNLMPVFFFIHGGGNVYGSAMEGAFNASIWSALYDIVVVVPNYRLGAFGFFHANRTDAPGNAAMWDQHFALQWTKNNIASFGGDPNRVNLAGQSAGSASVGIHIVSPLSRPLFKRATMMSGSPFVNPSAEQNIDKSKRLAGLLGCDVNKVIDYVTCLRAVSVEDILNVTMSYPYFTFAPNYGDQLYPVAAPKALTSTPLQAQQLELMSGLDDDEGVYVLFIYCLGIPGFERRSPGIATKQAAKNCIQNSMWHSIKDAAADYYLKNVPDDDSNAIRKAAAKCVGDFIFTCPTYFYSSWFARRIETGHVFSYHLSYATKWSYFCANSDWPVICHADELFPMFGDPLRRPWYYNETDAKYATDLMNVFTNWTFNGIPQTQDMIKWPYYQQMPMTSAATAVTLTPNFNIPTWPSNVNLNPFKKLTVKFKPYFDCDNFWVNHLDIWLPSTTTRQKYRSMEQRTKQWSKRYYYRV